MQRLLQFLLPRILSLFLFFTLYVFGGAAFESDKYLIWIGSKCPQGSTTCTSVTYNQTTKSNGKILTIVGGEPVVGNMSGNLIGYKFFDLQTKTSFELSLDLKNNYTLYIRKPRSFEQETIKPLREDVYLKKIQKIKNN